MLLMHEQEEIRRTYSSTKRSRTCATRLTSNVRVRSIKIRSMHVVIAIIMMLMTTNEDHDDDDHNDDEDELMMIARITIFHTPREMNPR